MRRFLGAAALLVLAGCQTGGDSGAQAGGKAGQCVDEAAKKFAMTPADVATSAEYPLAGAGTAIDGSVNKDGNIKLFRCEYDAAGAFQRVSEVKDGQ